MFNFKSGIPVALTPENKMIYLTEKAPIELKETKLKDETKLAIKKVLKIVDDTFDKFTSTSKGMIPLYKDVKNQRESEVVSAPSGAGKSTYSKLRCKAYKAQFPNNKMYLLTRLDEKDDPEYAEMGVEKLPIDEDLKEEPYTANNFHDCLIIFDDTDTLAAPYKKIIAKLLDDCLQVGRHMSQTLMITNHMLRNYKDSRITLLEANDFVIFPSSGGWFDAEKTLKSYCSLSKKQLDAIKALPSRWVAVYKTCPQYVMWESGICNLEML